MQFVETLDGALVPLSRIDRLWSKGGSVWIKADDETHQIIGTLDKIRDALEPIIPASLGWEVITPAENNDGFLVSVLAEPVIGWRDCEHGPTPITATQSENNAFFGRLRPPMARFSISWQTRDLRPATNGSPPQGSAGTKSRPPDELAALLYLRDVEPFRSGSPSVTASAPR